MTATPLHRSNRQVRLAARPSGLPKAGDWRFTEEPVGDPPPGGLLVEVTHVSLDPAMRGWMNEGRSYIAPVAIGEVMRAAGVGRVIASGHPAWAEGDAVAGTFGVQEVASVAAAEARIVGLRRIDLDLAGPTQWLNVLGMPGMTGYFGLLEVGRPTVGETLVVSGAAGAVGQTVGQLGRLLGLKVVGIAGGPAKCDWVVNELGFDACIDYRLGEAALKDGLKTHCPQGVDVYFDNVGGEILDAVLARLARGARVVICGAISRYNAVEPPPGPRNYLSLLVNRARMEGMVVFDYAERFPQAVEELAGHLRSGRMKSKEDVVVGIEHFPEALLKLFGGGNFGKLVLQLAPRSGSEGG